MTDSGPDPDQQSPLDRFVDLVVYAPLGLAFIARDELPRLIAKGREGATGQVGMARVVGQFAVDKGQREAGRLLRQATDRLVDLGLVPDPDRRPGSPTRPTETPSGAGPPAPEPGPATGPGPGPPGEVPAVDSLAIPGYGSLSAPQVVQRLDGLSATELESVRVYESANRGRKTILSRVAQLQSAS